MAEQEPVSASSAIAPLGIRTWSPRDEIAPQMSGSIETTLKITSNGSQGCFGGWEVLYPSGKLYNHFRFSVRVRWRNLDHGFESIVAQAMWRNEVGERVDWTPVNDWSREDGWIRLQKDFDNDTGASQLVVQLLLRWSAIGEVEWADPTLTPVAPPLPRRLRLGAASARPATPLTDFESNCRRVLEICRRAGDEGIDLLCLPEVILQWRLPGKEGENLARYAVEVPGPCIEPFQELACDYEMAICLPVTERDKELVYNTAVLIGEDGQIIAKYRKVHLAVPTEDAWGLTPGSDFSVTQIRTAAAKVGMNICMDSSAAESARVVARHGGEILLLPIMGDLRADRWSRGRPQFDIERWMLIQRMRAMDNQLYLVAARNEGVGTGIFAPDGSILVMDGGDRPIVWADVDLADLKESMSGAKFRDILWFERRESQYASLSGSLLPKSDPPGTHRSSRSPDY